ncbi:PREDICTED: uncharacterized protein LOC108378455, partial [Rhagoletis zephyria]|uniref:uncharacterized protein LOC108378455 n=1 Tax=Rhagoletis zephyria TaxID=28612 RepID=UPI000811270A
MEAEGGARFGQYIHLRAPIRVKPFSSGPVLYKVQNESAQVTCRYSGYPRGHITWIVGNQKLNENELRYELGIELQASEEANDTLAIDHLQMDLHNTALTCRVDNTLTADEETLLLNVRENEVYINGPHVLAEKRELRIQCNISEHTNSDRSQVRWYKDNRNIDEIDELRDRVEVEHIQSSRQWTLVIKDAEIGDVGNYTCAHNVNNLNATTRVRSRPLLYPFEEFQATNYKSANVVEGERFSLRCAVAPGYERDARLQWFTYSEEEATGDSGTEPPPAHLLTPINDTHAHIRIEANYSSDSSGSSTGSSSGLSTSASTSGNNGGSDGRSGSSASVLVSVLTIAAVRREDRAYYVCKAHNEVVSFNNTILLRVKDRLAALWPFIGIVCEVLILVLVIFVYEKRRIKPDFDEPDSHNRNQNDEG